MWHPAKEKYVDAGEVMKEYGLVPVELTAKEGLALINGTQFITSLTTEGGFAVLAHHSLPPPHPVAALG